MRIGIDIDDTISNTFELLVEAALEYDKLFYGGKGFKNENAFKFDEMFYWTKDMAYRFLTERLETVMKKASIKSSVKNVVEKLKNEGNEIIIVTARSNKYYNNPYALSKKWLDDNNVLYDEILVGCHNKGLVCLNNNIDLLIDDLPANCMSAKLYNIDTLLFDNKYNQNETRFKRVSSWDEIYNLLSGVK